MMSALWNFISALWKMTSVFPWWIRALILWGAVYFAAMHAGLIALVLVAAAALWLVVLAGHAYRQGKLQPPPAFSSAFETFTATPAQAQPAGAQVPAAGQGAPPPVPRGEVQQLAVGLIERLAGNDAAKQQLENLVTVARTANARGEPLMGTISPASVVLFSGPQGTGKTDMARAFIGLLYGSNVLKQLNIVTAQSRDIIDAGAGGAGQAAEQLATAALDGALLIDNGEWLARRTGQGSGDFAVEIGRALLHVAEQNPGRSLIVVTGGPAFRRALLEDAELRAAWLGKLAIDEVTLEALEPAELMTVLDDLSRRANAFVPTGLRPFVQEQLTREKSKAGEHFDNIFAVRRLFDHALRRAKARGVQNSITLTREDFAVAV